MSVPHQQSMVAGDEASDHDVQPLSPSDRADTGPAAWQSSPSYRLTNSIAG
jgi:hypothetical protein